VDALKVATQPEIIENAKRVAKYVAKDNGAERIATRIDEMIKSGKTYIPKHP
jgi:hypothetical protein